MQPERNYEPPTEQPAPPPPLSTPGTQLYMYPTEPVAQPKKRVSIVWIVLGIILVPVFLEQALFGGQHSGVRYAGKELSKQDAQAAVQDIADITRGMRAGDPSSIHTDVQPRTALGKQFENLLITAQRNNAQYLSAIKDARSPGYLSPSQLGTESGREEAKRIHEHYIDATKTYRAQSEAYTADLTNFVAAISDSQPTTLAQFKTQDQELARLDDAEMQSISNMIEFVERAQPGYDTARNKLVFATEQDVKEYGALADDVFAKERALTETRARIMQERQVAMNQSMSTLARYAN